MRKCFQYRPKVRWALGPRTLGRHWVPSEICVPQVASKSAPDRKSLLCSPKVRGIDQIPEAFYRSETRVIPEIRRPKRFSWSESPSCPQMCPAALQRTRGRYIGCACVCNMFSCVCVCALVCTEETRRGREDTAGLEKKRWVSRGY